MISSHLTDAFGISYGHYRGLSWLIVLCCTASLLPLVLVPFLPTRPFHLRSTLRFDGALSGRT